MNVNRHMRKSLASAALVAALLAGSAAADNPPSHNVILITIDGVRIQEIFAGMDPVLAEHSESMEYSEIAQSRERYWRETPQARREALMPFFWSTLAPQGMVFGNKSVGSSVKVRNGILWSSPGYSEILTGEAQRDVVDNSLVRYPHRTVLEYVRSELQLRTHEVAQFGSWEGFKTIAASTDDAIFMNGAYDRVPAHLSSPQMDYLAELRPQIMGLWEESSNDVISYRLARDYLVRNRPRLMWLAFGQSDDWAHADRYDRLLSYLRLVDGMLEDLWEVLQASEAYRDKTTLVITTDHGRGLTGKDWVEHDASVPGSDDIWVAVIGPDTPDVGEVSEAATVHQSDIAATILQFFDLDYRDFNPDAGPPIPDTKSSD
ncbi:MAG: hypothetical protein ACREQ1_03815 [Woeseiaceae bacterium]